MAALAAVSGVVVYGAVEADRLGVLVLVLGGGALLVLAYALAAASPGAIVAALAGAGGSWSLSAWTRGAEAPDGTIFAAIGIFVAAELAYWSLEQVSVPDELELVARRAAGLAARSVGAFTLVAIVLAALDLRTGGGLVLEAVGIAALVGLLALVLVLARALHAAPER